MTRDKLYELLEKKVLITDGATGSFLQKAGMPTGVCPEQWILENPDVLIGLQKEYVKAGSDIIYAPTFTSNRIKLDEFGLADQTVRMNQELVALSKQAAEGKAYVAADMTMTGKSLKPLGELSLEELIDVYKEQAAALVEAGVDMFVVETMMSLAEARAAVIAIKETCCLPVIVSMSFEEDGKTLYGTSPACAAVVLGSIGADVVGVNCSTGPKEMIQIVKEMKEYASIPIIAKPNAGLPELEDGKTVYKMKPEEFVSYIPELIQTGANLLGGCCGTDPDFIEKIKETAKQFTPVSWKEEKIPCLASERKIQPIDLNGPFLLIGERMNPTGKKALQAELREGSLKLLLSMAEEQEEKGAKILDLNVGMNGIDEKETMLKAIEELGLTTSLPLCIDTSHVSIMEAALRAYPGRALINSVSLEKEKIEKALPIMKKYGAMFIILPLSDEGLPKNAEEKKQIIKTIMEKAAKLDIPKNHMIVDGLVATVGAQPEAALETLETIRYCKEELKLPSMAGLSNISFGLPDRMKINGAFLAMAMERGMTLAIANPNSQMLLDAMYASALLLHKPGSDLDYIKHCQSQTVPVLKAAETSTKMESKKEGQTADKGNVSLESEVFKSVVSGDRAGILEEVKKELERGTKPGSIINDQLIPGINKVGELFDKKMYFLPQLISSAEAMKKAIEYLEPMLSVDSKQEMAVVVIATVEGDVHDIGKNLVTLMFKNYGYRVIDLGKNVPKEDIVDTAVKENAAIIALSALMTTTMMEMKHVIEYKKEKGCPAKVIIGGAVTTQSFADEIGADGYSEDAAAAVKLVERLLK
ncbi:MAG: homocysteine S-methyltransferase family protein [Lachnospiraceae bacterium]|nr:homocysteine S-methyltransferase family protein [Lachnospiraceae bacterium]